jgi:16S rRNA U1498 N3-methylase RsmE
MNLILLEPKDFEGKNCCVRLKGRRFAHIHDILRSKKGYELSVGLIGGLSLQTYGSPPPHFVLWRANG